MKNIKYYTIYDKVAKVYGDIFPSSSDAFVIREISSLIKQNKIQYASDKLLYRIFEFNNLDAKINLNDELVLVLDLSTIKNEEIKHETN